MEKPDINIKKNSKGEVVGMDIDVSKSLLVKKVVGPRGERGTDGTDGKDGLTGEQGATGITGACGERGESGKDYNPEIEKQVSENTDLISSSKKTITEDLLQLDSNLLQHEDNEDVHFVGNEKEEFKNKLEKEVTQIVQTGNTPPHNYLQKLDGGKKIPKEYFHLNEKYFTDIQIDEALLYRDGHLPMTGILNMDDNGIIDSEFLTYTLSPNTLPLSQEGLTYWNDQEHTLNIDSGLGPVLQVGQELYIIVYNGTGETIPNGSAVYPVGGFEGRPSVALASAETHVTFAGDVIIATMDIPDGTEGIASKFGVVRGIDASMWNLGDTLWLSAENPGELTNVKPEFPDYIVQVGGVTNNSETEGSIIVDVIGKAIDTIQNFWNGTFRETINFTVDSDGNTILGTLDVDNGHEDMTMMFSDGFSMFNVGSDPSLFNNIIELTPGTDSLPVTNYIYVLKSTKELEVSTDSWPFSVEHIKVAQVFLQSAVTTQTAGALRNQNWNDHIESTQTFQGHLSHITEKIRQFECQWDSGTEGSMTAPIVGGGTDTDVLVTVTSGTTYQLHRHTFPSQVMPTNDIHIVNDISTPYERVNNLNTQTTSAASVENPAGVTLTNSSFSFVVWGVQNRVGEESHIMCNLPTGTYLKNQPDSAIEDAKNYSVYTIPKAFQGVGFLIARFTMILQANGTDWTLHAVEDLRGRIPNTSAGGGSGGGGATSFLGLDDTPSGYVGEALKIAQVDATENFLEFTNSPVFDSLSITNNLTVTGDITGDNLSGTNTGDQDLSGLVPYTGATANVDLGVRTLETDGLLLHDNGEDKTLTFLHDTVFGGLNDATITIASNDEDGEHSIYLSNWDDKVRCQTYC